MKKLSLVISAIIFYASSLMPQSTNIWLQKANFPGAARSGAVAFSIGSKIYITTGRNGSTYYSYLWEYDPSTNSWT